MISVITTAYNHQNTLQRAIDSVRAQKGVEIQHIVIDDTVRKHGLMLTFYEAFKRCEGEYIAFCDGDDYWTCTDKLSIQKKYLDDHPEVGLCFTLVYTGGDHTGWKSLEFMPVNATDINSKMSFDRLLKGNAFIHAQSYLIRKSVLDQYIDFAKFIVLGFRTWDYPIVLDLINHTQFHCMDFYSAVYTKNLESVTNTRSRKKRFEYILNSYKIKLYFIKKYGCRVSTIIYLLYLFIRHLYSITFRRWVR